MIQEEKRIFVRFIEKEGMNAGKCNED